jgi:hypothetical protein
MRTLSVEVTRSIKAVNLKVLVVSGGSFIRHSWRRWCSAGPALLDLAQCQDETALACFCAMLFCLFLSMEQGRILWTKEKL